MSESPCNCGIEGCELCDNCGSSVWPDPMGGKIHMPETICQARIPRDFTKKTEECP